MTGLQALNWFVLPWFGVRLARVVEKDRQTGWAWLTRVVPLTGWGTPYRYF